MPCPDQRPPVTAQQRQHEEPEMNPFATLTPAGQCRRLHALARQALEVYDLTHIQSVPLAVHSNTLFKVTAAEGVFVLRVSIPDQRTLLEIQSELAWLAALRRETDLVVPEAIPARSGAVVVTATVPGVPEPRHCVLFRWMPGRAVPDQLPAPLAFRAGATLAQLHDHADRFQPPPPFSTTQLDRAWTFGLPAGLTSAAPDPLWPPARRHLVRRVGEEVQALLDQLYADPAQRRFLHLDFHPGNLKQHDGQIAVLDFDDTRWAYPVQDLGTALYYLFDEPGSAEMRAQFLAGYASVRPAGVPPAAQLDLCLAARQIDLLSYVLAMDVLPPAELGGWLDTVERRLRTLFPTLS
jgi:Ser/Thr protein kinase RdoA (MazF antagonist)